MPKFKLPKPIKRKLPPKRIGLYSPKVDLTKAQLQDTFIVVDDEYLPAPNLPEELQLLTVEVPHETANLISSKCESGKHAPVIDIDFPIAVYPSSQLGHYHLYIDKEITWTQYVRILKALSSAGIIETGYLKASLEKGYTAVRPVGVVKPDAPKGSNVLVENASLKKKLIECFNEIEHLQKEIQAGIPDDLIEEVKELRKRTKKLSDDLSERLGELCDLKLSYIELEDQKKAIETNIENSVANSNPKLYNMTWL